MYLIYRTASIHQAVESRSARVDDIGARRQVASDGRDL